MWSVNLGAWSVTLDGLWVTLTYWLWPNAHTLEGEGDDVGEGESCRGSG